MVNNSKIRNFKINVKMCLISRFNMFLANPLLNILHPVPRSGYYILKPISWMA
jgi:hypothetical protein